MKSRRTLFAALAAAAAFALAAASAPALAQQDDAASSHPAVAAAASANTAITQCITAVTTGAATADPGVKTLLLIQAPDMCRKSIVVAQVRQGPGAGEMTWDVVKTGLQLWAGYKGQALVWGAVTSLVDRGFDATENTASQGLSTAQTLGTLGMEHASKPPLVIQAAPAASSSEGQ